MKKTFATTMPDKIGAFMRATEIFARLKINILRVSYNKAIDAHMLFIEVNGEEDALNIAKSELIKAGYILNDFKKGKVVLLEFNILNKPGALLPVLRLIDKYKFNISYISSKENESDFLIFKMGLLIEKEENLNNFLEDAQKLCRVKIIDFEKSNINLDNTVFYISFVNKIAEDMGLLEEEKNELLINSNHIMQILDEKNLPPYKTFDYILKFGKHIKRNKGDNYKPRVSDFNLCNDVSLIVVEPPCGSNVCVFVLKDILLFVDSGFNCYKEELLKVLKDKIKDFNSFKKEIILTHSDVDHIGFLDWFDKVYLSENTAINLLNVSKGKKGYREQLNSHKPYVKISKILSHYKYPECKNFNIIGTKNDDKLLSFIGRLKKETLDFEVYEGMGGHVKGETVFIERNKRIVFTGDIFINIKDCIKEQEEFNKIAPNLLTAVDSVPDMAYKIRREIKPLLDKGKWIVIGGHGAPLIWDV